MVQENVDLLSTAATVVNNKLIFFSELGVLCLLPASLGIWQAHLLACKLSTISEPSLEARESETGKKIKPKQMYFEWVSSVDT